jgi:hypothetical protein
MEDKTKKLEKVVKKEEVKVAEKVEMAPSSSQFFPANKRPRV